MSPALSFVKCLQLSLAIFTAPASGCVLGVSLQAYFLGLCTLVTITIATGCLLLLCVGCELHSEWFVTFVSCTEQHGLGASVCPTTVVHNVGTGYMHVDVVGPLKWLRFMGCSFRRQPAVLG